MISEMRMSKPLFFLRGSRRTWRYTVQSAWRKLAHQELSVVHQELSREGEYSLLIGPDLGPLYQEFTEEDGTAEDTRRTADYH